MRYLRHDTVQQDHMTVRRITTSTPAKQAVRKDAMKVYPKNAPKKAAAEKPAKRLAEPSRAAIMLKDLRPSVDALRDRVEKLRLRFA